MQRRYSEQELNQYFGQRDYFKCMTSDQIYNILGYVSARYKIDLPILQEKLTDPETNLIETNDAQVYIVLQELITNQPPEDNEYYKIQASIIVKSYRSMCRNKGYNFKQPITAIMDFGSDDKNLMFNMKREFYAKYAIGINVDKYKLERCQQALTELNGLKDGQVDIINCDSVLHSVTDSQMKPVLDELIRVCSKYIIIKDFQLGDDYQIMQQFAVSRELASGVLKNSDIPDCILTDEEGLSDPSIFYNQEFSIERIIKYLTTDHFEIVAQPQLKKSVGNPKIYILKKQSFQPWILSEQNWNAVQNKTTKQQEINQLKNKYFKEARNLQGKAISAPTRDARQKQVTQLLNKIATANYDELSKKLISVFSDAYQSISVNERTDFLNGITQRLFSRAKNCRNTGNMFANIYQELSAAELFISNTSIIHDQVQQLCINFIQDITAILNSNDPETYEQLNAQITCVTSFVRYSLQLQIINPQLVKDMINDLNSKPHNNNADYIQSIIQLLQMLYTTNPDIADSIHFDLHALANSESNRIRCIALNTIDFIKELQQ